MCRVAVSEGIAPEAALLDGDAAPARCHRLLGPRGGRARARADLLLLDDLETFIPARVYKDGVQVAAGGRAEPFPRPLIPERVLSTMRAAPMAVGAFAIPAAARVRVIETIPGRSSRARARRRRRCATAMWSPTPSATSPRWP